MRIVLLAEYQSDINSIVDTIISLYKDYEFSIIENSFGYKELSKRLFDNKIKNSVVEYKINSENYKEELKKIVNKFDKVLLISNNGIYSKELVKYSNVEFFLDRVPKIGRYIDLADYEIINISEKLNPIRVNGDIESLKKIQKDKLLITLYNSKIIGDNLNSLEVVYSYLRSIGIYIDIEDNLFSSMGIYDICNRLGLLTFESFILDSNLRKENLSLAMDIYRPKVNEMERLYNRDRDMERAIELLEKYKDKKIAIVSDSDCDGVNGAAIGYKFFKEYLGYNVEVIVNEREFGNGVNDEMVNRIIDSRCKLLITVDHGSKDHTRYEKLKESGIKIIVTDHHELDKERGRPDVDAFINCMDRESSLPEYISGTTVLYSLFLNYIERISGKRDYLEELIPHVAITIISDVMDLSKPLNRYLFHYGRELMESDLRPPYIEAVDLKQFNSLALSFNLISYINAANRMGSAYKAYRFLISENIHTAIEEFKELERLNIKKREIVKSRFTEVEKFIYDNVVIGITEENKSGILSLLANKLISNFGVTTAVLTLNSDGNYVGSIRSVGDNVNIVDILTHIDSQSDIFIKFGGHKGAGGFTIYRDKLEEFKESLHRVVPKEVEFIRNRPIEIPIRALNLNTYSVLDRLDPYGNGFNRVHFRIKGVVEKIIKRGITLFKLNDGSSSVLIKSFNRHNIKEGDRASFIVELRRVDSLDVWEVE